MGDYRGAGRDGEAAGNDGVAGDGGAVGNEGAVDDDSAVDNSGVADDGGGMRDRGGAGRGGRISGGGIACTAASGRGGGDGPPADVSRGGARGPAIGCGRGTWGPGGGDARSRHERFCREASRQIGIPLEMDGLYRWIVFLPSKGTGAGALNRYYGLFESGEMKVRGIELRRHDTPAFIRRAQSDMLRIFSSARDSEGFLDLMPRALRVLERRRDELVGGGCDVRELVLTRRVSRELEEYRHRNDGAAALEQLRNLGRAIRPGQSVRYVMVDGSSRDCMRRVRVAELLTGADDGCGYDAQRYLDLLIRSGETLLAPFGYDEAALRRFLQQPRMT